MLRLRNTSKAPLFSPYYRTKQFPGVLHDSGGKLFCTLCNCVLDHRRKMVKAAAEAGRKRQLTYTEASTSKTVICETWVATCTAINIPLSKSDHPTLRKFLNENVINGGAIPGFHQLQDMYLGAVYERENEEDCTLCIGST
uniref:Uncharacterized protein n=1 Tax=Cyprinus carpio TaxID=7962 RepID=A0A8C1T2I3_CYPCA